MTSPPPPCGPIDLHASAVAFGGYGVLIRGASGAGKSRLALACLAHGARLIADDAVTAQTRPDGVWLEAPPARFDARPTYGLIEARGVGLLRLPTARLAEGPTRLQLIVDLNATLDDRLPPRRRTRLFGHSFPLIYVSTEIDAPSIVAALAGGATIQDPDHATAPPLGTPASSQGPSQRRPTTGEAHSQMSEAAHASIASIEDAQRTRIVLVTGRSGAGRTTAMSALEDLGYETVDTPPLQFVPAIVDQALAGPSCRLAIGIDSRTRGFSLDGFADAVQALRGRAETAGPERFQLTILFLDSDDETLRRRYTETRRRHPMAPTGSIEDGIARDRAEMAPLREHATAVIDTSPLTAAALKQELRERLATEDAPGLSVTVTSFSYRRGLPPEADLTFDCRFLRNPHYVDRLRPHDGRDPEVAAYVSADPLYARFMEQLVDFAETLLPAYRAEGKSYLTIAFGCTGGRHRSVAVAEAFAYSLRALGWTPHLRHREQEGGAGAAAESS